jgi:hypothetical protein
VAYATLSRPNGVLCGFRLSPLGREGHQGVHGAPNALPASVQHVRVDHRSLDISMTKKLLNSSDVVPVLQEVRGPARCGINSGMPKRVARSVFRGAGPTPAGRPRWPKASRDPAAVSRPMPPRLGTPTADIKSRCSPALNWNGEPFPVDVPQPSNLKAWELHSKPSCLSRRIWVTLKAASAARALASRPMYGRPECGRFSSFWFHPTA